MLPAHVNEELKQLNKKRTFGLLGFLFILVFFPVFFSNQGDKRENQTPAAVLAAQDNDIQANQQVSQQPSRAPGQQGSPTQAPKGEPTQIINFQVQEEPYSPQPSIWLFIIPIVVTFFTILFY